MKVVNNVIRATARVNAAANGAARSADAGGKVLTEVEWLLDNRYLIEREGKQAISELKRRSGGSPALYLALKRHVAETRGGVSAEGLDAFLGGYGGLSGREAALFLPFLKSALVEYAAEAACSLGSVRRPRKRAEPDPEKEQTLGQTITALRLFSSFDLSELLLKHGKAHAAIKDAPLYAESAEETREYMRRGYEENGEIKPPSAPRAAGALYISAIILLTCAASVCAGLFTRSWVIGVLSGAAFFEIFKTLADWAAARLVRPAHIPRLAYEDGVPAHARTLVVITAVVRGAADAAALVKKLARYRVTNRDAGENVVYGLLLDRPDGDAEPPPLDFKPEGFSSPLFVFTRRQVYSEREKKYSGWDRKRGAITELCRFLRGAESRVSCASYSGELGDIKYLITLDSDTRPSAGSIKQLVGAAAHPLNKPVIDERRKVVVSGHAVLQPRMGVDLKAANKNFFTKIFAGLGGIDPYCGGVSDVYQDLFGRGAFVGKGIIDVDAFSECLDGRLPENRLLSHDLTEGSYLRAGFVGDVEWTDGWPSSVRSWLERSHRWVRGDWQTAGWLGAYVPRSVGRFSARVKRERNPLAFLPRWQIFDNLRRCVTAIITPLALISGSGLLAGVYALSLCTHLLITALEPLTNRARIRGQRFQSAVVTGFKAALYQTFTRFLLAPAAAWVNLSAALTAMWRVNVSKRGTLQWRTAEESDAETPRGAFRFVWTGAVFGAVTFAIWATPLAAVAGAVWAFSPRYFEMISKPANKPRGRRRDALLIEQARKIWRYFEELANEREHFLPPDNFQERPKPAGSDGVAHRTSPTNIGLAMLSALAAADLGVVSEERAAGFIGDMLTTVEKLPAWKGHLYNWYDTETLKPLRPVSVSTVDGGNFSGALIAVREGLLEMGETALAERAHKLYAAADYSLLYDPKRRLFHIGYDAELGKLTDGYYDLLASEARQASYVAVARGQVPRSHWRRLGRVLAARERYSGMVSWTGTMFEYVMPHLLLPAPENSLMGESLKFAVYCQRRRGGGDTPWGISESCFRAFDNEMNYQYKAHGDPKLAYKRGMGKERVIAPYASFLALQVDFPNALKNLKLLKSLGADGKYGLIEALDFTPERTGDADFLPAECHMSHHIGMSIVAIDNALNGNVMQKRFMRDAEMGAYIELLEEKLPVGGVVMGGKSAEAPLKPARAAAPGWERVYEVTGGSPNCALLSNGSYVLFCRDDGVNESVSNGMNLTRPGHGWSFFIREGGYVTPLTFDPERPDASAEYGAVFDLSSARWTRKTADLMTVITARVAAGEHGEHRAVELKNLTGERAELELISYFEPALAEAAAYEAHPAFSKLFIQAKASGGSVTVSRRPRSKEQSGACLTVTCGAENVLCGLSREDVRGRTGGFRESALKPGSGVTVSPLDPCVCQSVTLTLEPGGSRKVSFALCAAAEAEDCESGAERILLGCEAAGIGDFIRRSGIEPNKAKEAFDTLSRISAGGVNNACAVNKLGQRSLWRFGISGDLPLILADTQDPDKLDVILRRHRFLTLCGLSADLAVIDRDGADYRRPTAARVRETLKDLGSEYTLSARGGVHVVGLGEDEAGDYNLLAACAAGTVNHKRAAALTPKSLRSGFEPLAYGHNPDGSFTFSGLPEIAWGHTLANRSFGALVRDGGLGHVWRKNARENKITPWDNDPLALQGGEKLYIATGGELVSPFAAGDGYRCKVTYGFGFARWEKFIGALRVKTTAFVPPHAGARVIIIDLNGADAERAVIRHSVSFILGADAKHARHAVVTREGDCVCVRNGYNTDFNPRRVHLRADGTASEYNINGNSVSYALKPRRTGGAFGAVIVLGESSNAPGSELVRDLADTGTARAELEKTVNWWKDAVAPVKFASGDAGMDAYLNGWAMYQVICSRLFARASLYQCGGAYGFRDQLQDVCAAVYSLPGTARAHILRACARQFEEGDVMHWWHPANRVTGKSERGVRTRISDDLLWLPYAVREYIEVTGDGAILDVKVPFLSAPPLEDGEHDRFDAPDVSAERGSVAEHCRRAVECVLRRGAGEHGLLLIGGGDWNDGFDKVGIEGRGESVWLTWFAARVIDDCADFLPFDAERYRAAARELSAAADAAWDGAWYLRGYYDDGTELGSERSAECRIDSIAQSFAALAPRADAGKVLTALNSARNRLADGDNRLIKLFAPPFDKSDAEPGYIKGYLPGVRENGGQYTHAAVWLAMGFALAGKRGEAYGILKTLLPSGRDPKVYKTEPYVLAADVYAAREHIGRGGWTHYTGAAAWYWRTALTVCEHEVKKSDNLFTKN